MIRVFNTADAVFIDGYRSALIAGTLVATANGDTIAITTVNSTEALAAGPFTIFGREDGSSFPDAPTCLAYLKATCGQVLQRVPTVSGVAGEAIATGMPVARSRADGTLRLARGDTYALAFLAGIASADTAAGFRRRGEAVRSSLSLPDWTAIAGAPLLAQGQRYFLAPDRRPPRRARADTGHRPLRRRRRLRVDLPTTLAFQPTDPILL